MIRRLSHIVLLISLVIASSGMSILQGQVDGTLKGTFKWTTGSVFLSSPAIGADGTIYIGSENSNPSDSFVLAIDPAGFTLPPGQPVPPKWAYRVPDWIDGSPAVAADGTIYIGCWDGKLYAFRESGSLKWTYDTDNFINSSPAVGLDGTIYVGSGDGNLHAINPDGSDRWLYPTLDWVDSSPAIGADGTVYIGSWDHSLYAISADGDLRWSYPTEGPILSSPAIGEDGTVYVGSDDGIVYAIDSDGELVWDYPTGDAIESSPALGVDGTVYVGSLDGYLYAIASDGILRWRYYVSYVIISSPAVRSDGSIVFGAGDSNITCVSSAGDYVWSVETGDWADSSPAIAADGTIYAGSFDNSIYAIAGDYGLADSAWPEFHLDSARTGAAPDPSDPLLGGQPVSGLEGWYFSEWFGFYNTSLAPWLFHAQHGFIYHLPESTDADTYFYDDAMVTWWWTNSTDYPSLFAFDPPADNAGTDIGNEWLWYFEGTLGPRSFTVLTGPSAGTFLFFNP